MALSRSLGMVLTCSLLAGCTTTAQRPTFSSNEVLLARNETGIYLSGTRQNTLTRTDRDALQSLIYRESRGRRDAIYLLVTSSSQALKRATVREIARMGVPTGNVRSLMEPADPKGLYRVRVDAGVYSPLIPACTEASKYGPSAFDNSFDESLGCSTRHNLAMTVSDPKHLHHNASVEATPADRAVIPASGYTRYSQTQNNSGANSSGAAPITSTGNTGAAEGAAQ